MSLIIDRILDSSVSELFAHCIDQYKDQLLRGSLPGCSVLESAGCRLERIIKERELSVNDIKHIRAAYDEQQRKNRIRDLPYLRDEVAEEELIKKEYIAKLDAQAGILQKLLVVQTTLSLVKLAEVEKERRAIKKN